MGLFRDIFLPGDVRPVRRSRHDLHVLHAQSWAVDADGKLLWTDPWMSNILHDEGEIAILSAYFDTDLSTYGAPPASLYLGLDNRTTPAEADTLASLSGEPSGNGYSRKAISTTTGFTIAASAPYNQATSTTQSYTASGGTIGPVKNRFLCTVSTGTSGKLLATVALSTTRTLNDTDTLNTNIVLQLD